MKINYKLISSPFSFNAISNQVICYIDKILSSYEKIIFLKEDKTELSLKSEDVRENPKEDLGDIRLFTNQL